MDISPNDEHTILSSSIFFSPSLSLSLSLSRND